MSKRTGKPKGRPKGTTNMIRSAEEKERIVLAWRKTNESQSAFCNGVGLNPRLISVWNRKYEKDGLEGLRSKTGKCGSGNIFSALHTSKKLSEVERLKLELMKKEIEIERLKKGYMVKGAGSSKEYVPINKKNLK